MPSVKIAWMILIAFLGIPLLSVLALADGDQDRPVEPSSPEAWYGETIRSSRWRSPEEELQGFHVPPGFTVELVVAEPRILKPMNLAFDAAGRLWCTESIQYPFPARDVERGADSISIHEDKDGDGTFESSRIFADGLNIPIGLLPYQDGVLAFSIPNIYFLRDTNGDGVCDERKIVLGPFDTSRDTHGMVNALRDGGDGWIYACHGFNNISKLAGTDGHTIELSSGNVFRFRPDGSRVEQYTQGQVNPFGMTRDEYGNWFTADCHSKPITQLLRGACYPSFGRPDDGLGFVPPMMDHLHGSTAISGIAYVDKGTFSEPYQGNLLSGNVMTCRINRNRLEYHGATAKAIELPDLLTSDDPWFRPVDLQFGPDGNLYIADFYNRIIGHYEVPLDHPDRDRTSGRIWRIRSASTDNSSAQSKTKRTGVPTSTTASLAPRPIAIDAAIAMVRNVDVDRQDTAIAMRRIQAIETLGTSGTMEHLPILLNSLQSVDEAFDPILKQAHWIAMRDIVAREAKKGTPLPKSLLTDTAIEERSGLVLKLLRAVRDPSAAHWSIEVIESIGERLPNQWSTPWLRDAVLHVSTVASDEDTPRVLNLLERVTTEPDSRSELVLRVAEAQRQRNGRISQKLIEYGEVALSQQLALWDRPTDGKIANTTLHAWSARAARGIDARDWPIEPRQIDLQGSNGKSPIPFWSSFGLGERYTGSWTSSPIDAPAKLSFWIVGHNGLPSEPDLKSNYVRILAQNASTRDWSEVHRIYPPRSDTGRRIELDLVEHVGRKLRIQVVDGDGHDSYAWLGIADVSDAGLSRSVDHENFEKLKRMVQCFGPAIATQPSSPKTTVFLDAWSRWMRSPRLDAACKVSLQKSMLGSQAPVVAELMDVLVERGWEDLLEPASTTAANVPDYTWDWNQLDAKTVSWLADQVCRRSNAEGQDELALRWSRHRTSIPLVESLLRRGVMSKDALRVLPASWWDSLTPEDAARLADLRPVGELDTTRAAIVAKRAAAVETAPTDLAIGAKVFSDRCAACHQLAGQGKVVGPQLDGAITRTIDRLCEDILWPNRNVDEAFRVTNVLLESGETVSGLVIDRQNDTIELVDSTGKSQRIAREEIEEEKISRLSLMPSNMEEVISESELASLIAYLKSKSQTATLGNQ
jgi:putative heme-binding domain-containing protein